MSRPSGLTTATEADPSAPSVAGASARLLGAQVAGNAGFFVAVLLLARILGPADRGTIAFLMVTAMILGRLSTLGVEQATVVFAAKDPAQRPALLTNALAFVGVVGILFGLAAVGVLTLLRDVRPAGIGPVELALIAAGTPAAGLISAGEAFLVGSSRFRAQALVAGIVPWIYAGALALAAAGPGLGVRGAALVWTTTHLSWAAVYAAVGARGTGIARRLDATLLRRSVAYGSRAWAGTLSRFLNFRLDQLVLGFLGTEAALGAYAVAVNASEILLYLAGAAAFALLPIVAGGEIATGTGRVLRTFRGVFLLTAGAALVSAAAGPFLIPLVFGEPFRASVAPFLWLVPGALAYVAFAIFTNALLATASPGFSSFAPVLALVTSLALDFVLIPPYGEVGAAIAATSAFVVGGIAAAWAYRHRNPFRLGELLPRRGDVKGLAAVALPVIRGGFGRPH